MQQQVLGGGVIVLIIVLLWVVYLLPSWAGRSQFQSSERNAVRLNQALRVLAYTSDTPEEVQVELSARTALAQQRLARRALAEKERTDLERARVGLERARAERVAARYLPEVRRARARRTARVTLWVLSAVALVAAAAGAIAIGSSWGGWALGSGIALAAVSGLALRRMRVVAARQAARDLPVATAPRASFPVPDVQLPATPRPKWQPRSLPQPLTASAGSHASSVLDAAAAREAVRQAAREDAHRVAAASQLSAAHPAPIATAKSAWHARPDFAAMGYVDDAEIEAHVRQILHRRAAGE